MWLARRDGKTGVVLLVESECNEGPNAGKLERIAVKRPALGSKTIIEIYADMRIMHLNMSNSPTSPLV